MIWHLYFDGEPVLIAHICDDHRAAGRLLACDDAGPDGDCAHVQMRACDCPTPRACDARHAHAEVA